MLYVSYVMLLSFQPKFSSALIFPFHFCLDFLDLIVHCVCCLLGAEFQLNPEKEKHLHMQGLVDSVYVMLHHYTPLHFNKYHAMPFLPAIIILFSSSSFS